MSRSSSFDQLLEVANRPDLRETGGGHNNKGVEFQRHWAVLRMFELTDDGAKDFLLLFEAIQDVAVIDSATQPTSICVYQVKKKDRNEWSWAELTALHEPMSKKLKPLAAVCDSPIGKLYASVKALTAFKSTGGFVSNAGCNLPLVDCTNTATSLPTTLASLSASHLQLLSKGLETLHAEGEDVPDLSRIHVQRVILTPDDPGSALVGKVHDFMLSRSPRHAGQARALVDALLAKIGPLAAKTDTCRTFDEIRQTCGYSKAEFDRALGDLQTIPDALANLETCLASLSREGMSIIQSIAISNAAAAFYRRQVMGNRTPDEQRLIDDCDNWLASNLAAANLLPFLNEGVTFLRTREHSFRYPELAAYLLLRAITLCVDQTSEN
jgi:hypothetical protein